MNSRFKLGVVTLGLAVALVVAALLIPWLKLPADQTTFLVGLLLAGPPEILCVVAVVILGKENFDRLAPRAARNRPVSQLRYYAGLAGCILNGLPLALYAYVPSIMPGGATRIYILVIADLVFVGSLFLVGGEFWEKLRRLFVWEGK